MEYKNKKEILACKHEWKKSMLLYTTVEDCCKCNVKKEDWVSHLSKEVNVSVKDKYGRTPFELYSKLIVDEMIDNMSNRLYEEIDYEEKYIFDGISGSQLMFDDIIRREYKSEMSDQQWEKQINSGL